MSSVTKEQITQLFKNMQPSAVLDPKRSFRKQSFNGWHQLFMTKANSGALFLPKIDDSDNPNRDFKFIITSEDVDDDREIPDVDDFAKNIDKMMNSERGVMVSVIHTDMLPGKVDLMKKMTLEEIGNLPDLDPQQVAGLGITEENKDTKCIFGKAHIYKDYPEMDDYVWHLVKTGKLNAVSLRGVGIPSDQKKCDKEGRCGTLVKNTRIWAVTLAPDGTQSSPRSKILAKNKRKGKKAPEDAFIQLIKQSDQMEDMENTDEPENAMQVLMSIRDDMKVLKENVDVPSKDDEAEEKMGDHEMDYDDEKMGDHDMDYEDKEKGPHPNKEDIHEDHDPDDDEVGQKKGKDDKEEQDNDSESDADSDDDVDVDVDVDTDDDDDEEDDDEEEFEMKKKDKSKTKDSDLDPLIRIRSSELSGLMTELKTLRKMKKETEEEAPPKDAAQIIRDEVAAQMEEVGIRKTKTPDPEHLGSGSEKGDPTAGTPETQGEEIEGPTWQDVNTFYQVKMRRQPTTDELQAHLWENQPLPEEAPKPYSPAFGNQLGPASSGGK